ncbi:lyzozyme M1 (1 4-beta-N-acetylmuramidase) [Roseburia sp. CAG:380]|nr:lyzozyme M1 (1 4-beta-N-acetylmuramidase) [Roseburia sp. CAG:380]
MSLSAAPHRSGGIRITWKLSSVWNGFVLYRSPKASGIYQPVATISSSRKSFTDKKVTAGKTYHYKAIPYIQKNGQTIYSNNTVIRRATARLMAPTFRVSRHRTASGRRFLQIRLRNNHGKYLRLRLKNNNIRQQKQTFRLQYSFRKATLSIRIRTYKQKKRTKGSFYSRAKVVRIRE